MTYIVSVEIVRTRQYLRDLKRMRVSPPEQAAMEQAIARDPVTGDVIRGLKGLRKMRFGFGGRGKRGGGRVVYFVMTARGAAIMLHAYAKAEKEDLSPGDMRALLAMLKELNDG